MVKWTNETEHKSGQGFYGFIYRIEYTDGTMYYGKKNFYFKRTLPPLEGKKRKRTKTVESDWRNYEGSSEWGKFKVARRKSIIKLARTKGELTYLEVECLVKERVLFRADCLNNNISGKFYPRNVGYKGTKWHSAIAVEKKSQNKDCVQDALNIAENNEEEKWRIVAKMDHSLASGRKCSENAQMKTWMNY